MSDTLAPRANEPTHHWQLTSTISVALVVGLVTAAIGVLTSRVDVVLLALPFLLSVALDIDRRPRDVACCDVQLEVDRQIGSDGSSAFSYRIALAVPLGAEFVHLRVTPQGARCYDLVLAAQAVPTVTGVVPVVHSGRQRVVEVAARLIGVDGAWWSAPGPAHHAERVVDPVIVELPTLPLPHRLTGLAGTHASARPGDGGEFRDLHRYAPGDRLRRIDWKATARRSQGVGDLYVRRTDATADATVVLVLDSRENIGERVSDWPARSRGPSGLTALDIAREAAASIAVAAIGMGDRVSLIDLAVLDGMVVAGSGKRHLDRLLRRIAASGSAGVRFSRVRAPIIPAGAMVYLLSTFLDDETTVVATRWRAAGHRVIGVDVLPTPRLDGSEPATRLAHRLLMAERRRRLADAQANGMELMRWQERDDEPSRAVALRTLARASRRRA